MMEVVTNTILVMAVIVLQYINISKQHIVSLKLQYCCMSIKSKAEGKDK